jgi:peroxiredoxin
VRYDLYLDADSHMLVRAEMDFADIVNRYLESDAGRPRYAVEQALCRFEPGSVRLDGPVADDAFVFEVPAGATRTESLASLFVPAAAESDDAFAEAGEPAAPKLPYPAPDFALTDLEGESFRLGEQRGRVVLLDFWATWCGPCRLSLPHLQELHKRFGERGLLVVGIDIGEDAETVREFVEERGLTFRMLLDEGDEVSPLFRVTGLPHTVLIDREGQVVKVYTGFAPEMAERMQTDIEAMLAGSASQPAASGDDGSGE